MPFNLTPTSATYTSPGKFGASISGGFARGASPTPSTGSFTVEGWLKGFSTATQVAIGQLNCFWIGSDAGTTNIVLHYGSGGTEVNILSSVPLNNGAWHHVEFDYDPAVGAKFFVDGTLVGSNATTMAAAGAVYTNQIEIKTFASGAFSYVGEVDEVAVWNSVQHTTGFTPRTAAISNSAGGLLALYHFDNDTLDSTGTSSAATAVTLTGPSSGVISVASTNFTVGANGTITGTVVVTPSDGGGGGTFTPTTVSISSGTPTGTFTYTPASTGAKTISVTNNGSLTNPSSITYTVTAAVPSFTTGLLFSPYNWDIQTSSAKTINAGAYFSTIFGGTTCALTFDMTGIAAPLPQISYRVDRFGPWTNVALASTITITIPSDTADYANKPGHLLEVRVKSMTETQPRWVTQTTAVKLTGITLDSGKTLSAPPALPLKAIFYGDSITEGVRTVNATATNDTDRNDSGQCWSLEVGRILGAEVGNVGFGATGFNVAGSGSVPPLTSSYNYLYSGVARSFSPSPDFIVLMEGTNDSGDVSANATTVLNGLIAATTAKIIVLRPFNGTAHATQLQAAIAACTTPSRCTYVDTAGFFTTANSADALHPYGVENITHIAPLVANAVRAVISSGVVPPVLTSRTVTLSGLKTDASTLATGLTGVKVSFRDSAGPDIVGLLSYQSSSQTITAGVLTFTVNTTLASGATGWIDIKTTGMHYCGQVVVS